MFGGLLSVSPDIKTPMVDKDYWYIFKEFIKHTGIQKTIV